MQCIRHVTELGWKSVGVLELTALPSVGPARWIPWVQAADVLLVEGNNKVSGAGGGGFIMLLSDPERRFAIVNALNANGGEASAVKLTFEGVEGWVVPDFDSSNRRARPM